MDIKKIISTSIGFSQIVSTPGLYQKVRNEEQNDKENNTEQGKLKNAEMSRFIVLFLGVVGILFVYLGIKNTSYIGFFGLLLLVIGTLYGVQLQKKITLLKKAVSYEKAPFQYRIFSVLVILMAFLPLVLVRTQIKEDLGASGLLLLPYQLALFIPSIIFIISFFINDKKRYKINLLIHIYFSLGCLLYGMFAFWVLSLSRGLV